MIELLSVPGLILIAGAALLALAPPRVRPGLFLLFPLVSLYYVMTLPDGFVVTGSLNGIELILLEMDALSRVFGIIFSITAFTGGVYAWHMKELGQQTMALMYAGGALGVTFAGDLLTLVVFWELMAVTSTWLIWARKTRESDGAGMRYLIYHVLGGGLLLSGILLHYADTSSLAIQTIPVTYTAANLLMLGGVAVNTAVVPLHTWLADAYPKATITGAVFMSAFTTKSAVYVLIRMFPGWDVLIWAGAAMAIYGVVYAVICKDIREILAYHIISQVGFMVCGIGLGTEMALNGATAHAYSHILYKSLLFMSTGAVLYAVGTSKMVNLGGLFSKLRWVFILYMIGALSISGLPLFNGYISKSMTISAAGYAHEETAMLLLLLASVGTFLSVGLKLPYYTWFSKSTDGDYDSLRPVPVNMYIAMGITAVACVFYGLFPDALYRYLPYAYKYNPFTIYHFVEVMQISMMTLIVFWVFRKKMAPEAVLALDVDWFYRKLTPAVRGLFVLRVDRFFDRAEELILAMASKLAVWFRDPLAKLINASSDSASAIPAESPRNSANYRPPIGVMMSFTLLFMTVLLLYILL